MKLVGIAGRKGAGKDTAALALGGYENVKFAGALKEMLRAYLRYVGENEDIIERMIEGDLKEVPSKHFCGKTFRYAAQTIGTEWGRDLIGKDIWINAFESRARQFDKVVSTDVRFHNEAAKIQEMGGTLIRVYDPLFIRPEVDHASEAEIDDLHVHVNITNNKTLLSVADFQEIIRSWVSYAQQGEAE